ncbi:MAG: nucleoside-diphosphate sugar epimerase/dehydratase [Hominisplanchenecus sp.]|nr:nucleoside-diphosphate sugar epimerase/dehydratase [Hominisplanchenecus sp.]
MKKYEKDVVRNKEMVLRGGALMFLDALIIIISMAGALWIRFDFHFGDISQEFIETVHDYLPVNIIVTILIYLIFKLYTSLWRFAGAEEMKNVILAGILSTAVQTIGMKAGGFAIPRSYPFLYLLLLVCLTVISRFSYRFLRLFYHNVQNMRKKKVMRTMIVGAGAAGYMIAREMKRSKHLNKKVCCIIDDSASKIGTYLQGIPIVGGKEKIPYFAEKYEIEEIVIAIPSLTHAAQQELLDICQQTTCKILILPGVYQLINEEVSVSMLREVQIEDLLGREPVNLEMEEIMDYVQDKVILVTGGGGSIGSEICRQLAMHHPKKLIIFDIYENNAYEIQNELKKKYPELDLEVLIGSVRNQKRVDTIFETCHPDLVYHAAAHKHVPLMEDSPNESIKNNVMGTWNVAHAADHYGAKKMVLISTDKAVRPTNIMGASKRLCELVIQSFAQDSKTEYAAVRFGNVLGSNGSVIPLFKKQIAEGGPVTVTHPDIIRYFMTIPEAVNLVLQCGALARKGEIFILDMGEPVKILDLAKKMIRLSGYIPDEDIKIEFTGLRPGEKLYEELLIDEENLKETTNKRIFVIQQTKVDSEKLKQDIHLLIEHAFEEAEDIREQVQRLVPEYVIKGH